MHRNEFPARSRSRRVLTAIGFGITILPAGAVAAQGAPDLIALNRSGRWSEVVELAPRLLADPAASTMGRCETRAGLVVALGRLRRDDDAAREADLFDGTCGSLAAEHWTRREVASIRAGLVPASARPAPLPRTGVDFSAVDAFWGAVDTLSRDVALSDAQWHALRGTAGNRLLPAFYLSDMRDLLDLSFRPSRQAERDSMAGAAPTNRAIGVRHFLRIASLRPSLARYRDTLNVAALVPDARRAAATMLPAGATEDGDAPLVAFAVFAPDGFAGDSGIVADLSIAFESDVRLFLAHELHHVYLTRLRDPVSGSGPVSEVRLAVHLANLRNEGIADLVDKPYPLTNMAPSMAWYTTRYNAEYARGAETVARLDSLLRSVADDSTTREAVVKRVPEVLVFNGHPAGAYIARTILESLGKDRLMEAVTNPAAFLRLFAEAETKRGRPNPWSPASLGLIARLESRYWRPAAP